VCIENKKILLSENFGSTFDVKLKKEDIELLKQFKDHEVFVLPDRNLNAKQLRLLECIGEILPNLTRLRGPFNDHRECLKDIPFNPDKRTKDVRLIFTNGNKMANEDSRSCLRDIPWLSARSTNKNKQKVIKVHLCPTASQEEINKRVIDIMRFIYYNIPTNELTIELDIKNPTQIKEGIEIAKSLLPKNVNDTRAIFSKVVNKKENLKGNLINKYCGCKKEYKDEDHRILYKGSKGSLPHTNLKINMVKLKDQIENGEGLSNSLELVMENHGEYYDQKWDEVGLVPYPRTPEPPTEKEKLISREWRDYIKVDEFPENVREEFEKICEENKSVFAYVPSDVKFVLEDGKTAEFDLDLSHDTPIWSKSFPIYGHMLEKLEKKIDQLLEHGLIEEIESPYNTNIFLVAHNSSNKHIKPEDREYRLVMDFRGLNAITRFSNRYSFMVKGVEAELSRLRGAKVFSLIDCEKSYRSCKASEKTKRICAFVVPNSTKYATKQFSFSSVSDGLASIPGYYSNLLQKALSETSRKHTICHIDDICVFSNSVEEHVIHLKMVLEDLKKSNFMIAARKVEFFKKRIKLLGHYISENTISIDQDRKTRISNMSAPRSRKEILQFLGVINYLFSFLDSIQLIAMPLYDALKGTTASNRITLNKIQLKAFEEIKQLVDRAQDLAIIDYSQPLHMEVDSSYVGCGSCVFQMRTDDKGIQHKDLIRFTSKRYSMQQAVCYSSLEKESLSILFSIQQNFNLLRNSVEAIIATDMKSLLSMLSCYSSTSNQRLSRISYFLYSLPFKWRLNHLSGINNGMSDMLSRAHPDYRSAFSFRLEQYADLERERIKLPQEWTETPNKILTTADLLKCIRSNVEKEQCSDRVQNKRRRAFNTIVESIMDKPYYENQIDKDMLLEVDEKLIGKEQPAQYYVQEGLKFPEKTEKDQQRMVFDKVKMKYYPVSLKSLITPNFIIEAQDKSPELSKIKMLLRTTLREDIPKRILKRYKLYNDNILVSKKKNNLPFEIDNIRIACDTQMALIIMSYHHLFTNHVGLNSLIRIFGASYKVTNMVTLAKLVTYSCRACRLDQTSSRNPTLPGRIPKPKRPLLTWYCDHLHLSENYVKGKKITGIFVIVDAFSSLVMAYPVRDTKAQTTIEVWKTCFASCGVPETIISDNASALNINVNVARFLRASGVRNVCTTSPMHSTANLAERSIGSIRRALKLASEMYQRPVLELLHPIVLALNQRPLDLVRYPAIKDYLKSDEKYISAFELHFGIKNSSSPLTQIEDAIGEQNMKKFRLRWEKIIEKLDDAREKELKAKNEKIVRTADFYVGQIVYNLNNTPSKTGVRFIRNLYEIEKISHKKYFLRPLFKSTEGLVAVHGSKIKAYKYSELYALLPKELSDLLGYVPSPDEIKEMAKENPDMLPHDLSPKNIINAKDHMQLKNRLIPRSVSSVPVLSIKEPSSISSYSSSYYYHPERDVFLNQEINQSVMDTPLTMQRQLKIPTNRVTRAQTRQLQDPHVTQLDIPPNINESPSNINHANQEPDEDILDDTFEEVILNSPHYEMEPEQDDSPMSEAFLTPEQLTPNMFNLSTTPEDNLSDISAEIERELTDRKVRKIVRSELRDHLSKSLGRLDLGASPEHLKMPEVQSLTSERSKLESTRNPTVWETLRKLAVSPIEKGKKLLDSVILTDRVRLPKRKERSPLTDSVIQPIIKRVKEAPLQPKSLKFDDDQIARTNEGAVYRTSKSYLKTGHGKQLVPANLEFTPDVSQTDIHMMSMIDENLQPPDNIRFGHREPQTYDLYSPEQPIAPRFKSTGAIPKRPIPFNLEPLSQDIIDKIERMKLKDTGQQDQGVPMELDATRAAEQSVYYTPSGGAKITPLSSSVKERVRELEKLKEKEQKKERGRPKGAKNKPHTERPVPYKTRFGRDVKPKKFGDE